MIYAKANANAKAKAKRHIGTRLAICSSLHGETNISKSSRWQHNHAKNAVFERATLSLQKKNCIRQDKERYKMEQAVHACRYYNYVGLIINKSRVYSTVTYCGDYTVNMDNLFVIS